MPHSVPNKSEPFSNEVGDTGECLSSHVKCPCYLHTLLFGSTIDGMMKDDLIEYVCVLFFPPSRVQIL